MLPRRFAFTALLAFAVVLAGATARLPGRAYALPSSVFTQNCGAPSEFFFDIPAGVTRITVQLNGGKGGASGAVGGFSGVATASFNVTAGQRYYLDLGCAGSSTGAGGWNGGGTSPDPVVTGPIPPGMTTPPAGVAGGGGGGASVLRASACATLPQPCTSGSLLVAAGGGGGGGGNSANFVGSPGAGGNGGSLAAGAGENGHNNSIGSEAGGTGATAAAPGTAGPFGVPGGAGDNPVIGAGGAGGQGEILAFSPPSNWANNPSGGGGGGGCHGAGGGSGGLFPPPGHSSAGGGGGSSCASAQAIAPIFNTSGVFGDGSATINYFMAPTITKTITSGSSFALGSVATLTFSLGNPQSDHSLNNVSFIDDLSAAGLVVAATPNLSTTCTGGTYAGFTFNSNLLNVGGILLPVSGTCTIAVDVTLTSLGAKTNTTGPVSSNESGPGGTASVAFTVVSPTSGTLTVHKHFSDSSATSVSFAVSCTAGAVPASSPLSATGTPDAPAVFTINNIPAGGTLCTATEPSVPSGYTVDASGCGSVAVARLGSASCTINNTVVPAGHATSTSVTTSAPGGSAFGSSVTFTATVLDTVTNTPAMSGSVSFLDGVTPLATVTVNALGQASFSTSALAVGVHTINANYGGVAGTLLPSAESVSQTVSVVGVAPLITSANATNFLVGAPGSFTVTATGSPAPTISQAGVLPSGVSFNPATHVLSGTPAAGTQGAYVITFTAANGTLPNAVQSFTLVVGAPCVAGTKGCVPPPGPPPSPPLPPPTTIGPTGPKGSPLP